MAQSHRGSAGVIDAAFSRGRTQGSSLTVQRVLYVGGIAVLAALYYGAAQFGFTFAFAGPIAAIVWLPAGVGIAFLYLAGVQFWPGVVIGDLLVNDYSTLPFGSALGQTFGNLLEVLVATLLLQAFARRRSLNGDARGVWPCSAGQNRNPRIGRGAIAARRAAHWVPPRLVDEHGEIEAVQALGVGEDVEFDDLAAGDREGAHRERTPLAHRDDAGGAVDQRATQGHLDL